MNLMISPSSVGEGNAGMLRELKRPDNRVLGICEYGDPRGFPVLAFHGVPGTRLMFRPTCAEAARVGLRIIAADRPGFGRSTPQPGRQLHDWLPEIEAILHFYGINRFALLGVSGGSPFAAATAAHFGNRVAAMALIGPMGPVAEIDAIALSRLERGFFLRLAKIPGALYALQAPAHGLFRFSPRLAYSVFLSLLPPGDRKILDNPDLREHVTEDVRESMAHNGEGLRTDVGIFARPWGIKYAQITAPTVLWQGCDDTIVPLAAALRLGDFIPDCTVHCVPGAGHFWSYDNIALILTTLRDMALRGHSARNAL